MFGKFELLIIMIVVCVLAIPFSIGAIIDILRSHFRGNYKIVWLLAVLCLSVPGLLLYIFIGTGDKIES